MVIKENLVMEKRNVSFLLIIGIMCMPYIFSWLTLKKGYSLTARLVSFSYLLFIFGSFTWAALNTDYTTQDTSTMETIDKSYQAYDLELEILNNQSGLGEFYDANTQLIWRRCVVGMTWDDSKSGCTGEAKRFSFAQAKKIMEETNSNWRLPTIDELATIRSCNIILSEETVKLPSGNITHESCIESTNRDFSSYETSLDNFIFSNIPRGYFWSISEDNINPLLIWAFDNRGGFIHKAPKITGKRHMLVVRNR